MTRVVIDTNVIVSSLVYAGKPARILDVAISREIINITSPYIVDEVRNVLAHKFLWHKKEVREAVQRLKSFSEMVIPKEHISVLSYDPDNRILECAVEGGADFIVTGDRHLKDFQIFQGIRIVDPAAFLSIITHDHEQ